MKRLILIIMIFAILVPLYGCHPMESVQIAATTLPVYEFTSILCQGTGLQVRQLITEEISCLHDYTLQVGQTKMLESAELVVISGAGLEEFLPDIDGDKLIDASTGIPLHCNSSHDEHTDTHHDSNEHAHVSDPHIWLSVQNAKTMCANIFDGLIKKYPEHNAILSGNYNLLITRLNELENHATTKLSQLPHKEMITFHDGFHYLAESFGLTILRAIEEESGSEASASELKELIVTVRDHKLPAIFTERTGSASAAGIISRETGVAVYSLDMAISGTSYFDAMYHNIDVLKEALG